MELKSLELELEPGESEVRERGVDDEGKRSS